MRRPLLEVPLRLLPALPLSLPPPLSAGGVPVPAGGVAAAAGGVSDPPCPLLGPLPTAGGSASPPGVGGALLPLPLLAPPSALLAAPSTACAASASVSRRTTQTL